MVYSDTTARKTFAVSRETLLSFDRVSAVIHVTHTSEKKQVSPLVQVISPVQAGERRMLALRCRALKPGVLHDGAHVSDLA